MCAKAKTLTSFIFTTLYCFSLCAQPTVINYHAGENNKKDLNQTYINTKTAAIKNLDNSYFEDGYVVMGADTVRCKIYLPKHNITNDLFLYIIARLPNDSTYVFSPKDISSYAVAGITMRAHRSAVSGDTNYFFIKLMEKGNITLYERTSVPSDKQYLYYFERPGAKELQYLAPYKENIVYRQETYGKESPMLSQYNEVDEALLKAALSEYLKDCESVRNKLSNNFYTIDDVETIIRDYNKCEK